MIMDCSIVAYLTSFLYASLYTRSHLIRKRFGRHEMNFSVYPYKECNYSWMVTFNRTERWHQMIYNKEYAM